MLVQPSDITGTLEEGEGEARGGGQEGGRRREREGIKLWLEGVGGCFCRSLHLHLGHLADAFIQSDLQ